MPDFERLTDSLMVLTAQTDAERRYATGFIAGKSKARKQVAYVVLGLAIGWVAFQALA